jgi:hypothetical protein
MAKIEVESAFVEDVISGANGVFGLKTAEPHSRKDDAGKWQTVARTFRSVKSSRDSGVSFDGFAKGDRVHIWGNEKTEKRTYEGKDYFDLVVWADRVEAVEPRSSHVPVQEQEAPAWTANDDSSTPF